MKREVRSGSEPGQIELAIRMLRMQARTQTIVAATRLSEDQIRRLYRQFCRGQVAARQRGRSPGKMSSFMRNLPLRFESSLFAGVLLKHGLLNGAQPPEWQTQPIQYGERFCRAYADYLPLAMHEPLSFERAWYFAHHLEAMSGMSLRSCQRCDSFFVHDDTDVRRQSCPMCKVRELVRLRDLRRKLAL